MYTHTHTHTCGLLVVRMLLTYVWINFCCMQLKDLYGEKSNFISKNYKLYTKDGHGHSDITDWFKLCRPEASTLALYFIQIQPEILSEYTHVPVLRSLLLKLV